MYTPTHKGHDIHTYIHVNEDSKPNYHCRLFPKTDIIRVKPTADKGKGN